jgi:hypothetical protein
MEPHDLVFVIPTYRLRDVGETVEQYDQHFWRNGHALRIIVFDDSSPANQDKYFPLLEQTHTHNELGYVGPTEKEQFLAYLNTRLRDRGNRRTRTGSDRRARSPSGLSARGRTEAIRRSNIEVRSSCSS